MLLINVMTLNQPIFLQIAFVRLYLQGWAPMQPKFSISPLVIKYLTLCSFWKSHEHRGPLSFSSLNCKLLLSLFSGMKTAFICVCVCVISLVKLFLSVTKIYVFMSNQCRNNSANLFSSSGSRLRFYGVRILLARFVCVFACRTCPCAV